MGVPKEPMAHYYRDGSQSHAGSELQVLALHQELEQPQEKWSLVLDHDTDGSDDRVVKVSVSGGPVENPQYAVAMLMEHMASVVVVLPVLVVDSDNRDLGCYCSEEAHLPLDDSYFHLLDSCCFAEL